MISLGSIGTNFLKRKTCRGSMWQGILLLLLTTTIALSGPAVADAGTWEEVAKLTAGDAAAAARPGAGGYRN